MKLNKKAMELPLNIVIMLIIGLTIFGIGFSMFSSFNQEGEEIVNNLGKQIKNDLSSIECQGEEWICAPSVEIKDGEDDTFQIFVVNRGDTREEFSVEIKAPRNSDGEPSISNTKCGEIFVYYPQVPIEIDSGKSAQIPYSVYTPRVKESPCSFTTTATLTTPDKEYKTPIIIRVD